MGTVWLNSQTLLETFRGLIINFSLLLYMFNYIQQLYEYIADLTNGGSNTLLVAGNMLLALSR